MLALPRTNKLTQLILFVGFSILAFFAFLSYHFHEAIPSVRTYTGATGRSKSGSAISFDPSLPAANATLGFGGLYVVSGPLSPRRDHLLQAAAVTELHLTIPQQPSWTEADIRRWRTDNESESLVGTGSVKAWLSHRLVLQAFLQSGLETALIFEDDVDWDIRLRTQQVPLAQRAAQLLVGSTHVAAAKYPWSNPGNWDLIYIGHCGDYFGFIDDEARAKHTASTLANVPHTLYEDHTMLDRRRLHPFTAEMLTAFQVPEQQRIFHKAQWPLCSFGYAVSRQGAQKILSTVAKDKEDLTQNISAYDVALLDACRDEKHLTCYTITPELFHHMDGVSLIASIESTDRQIFPPPVDAAGAEQVKLRMETSNIGCGFFSGEFYYDGDEEKLEYLKREVGRKGRCLKAKYGPQQP